MTVQYSSKVATATRSIGFLRLLFRWKGSIYKVVWMSLTLYMMIFFFLSYLYRFILDREQQEVFEKLAVYCRKYLGTIPLSFILGFYVDIVMERWWGQFTKIPWPDGVGIAVITSVKGTSEKSRLIRRTIMRYMNLSFVMTMQLISTQCKERFSNWDSMVEAGFLIDAEREIIERLSEHTDEPKYWLPLVWAANIAAKARKENKIYDDVSLNYLVKEINDFRTRCQILMCYDWVNIPIVYTQVVTLACYMYFTASVMARQFLIASEFVLDIEGEDFDMVVPIFLFIEFFFYMGWMNVAETMVNPFGADDDDFDINYFIDRHFQTSMAMVDDITNLLPEMAEDMFWNDSHGAQLPYTKAAMATRRAEPFQGSAAGLKIREEDNNFVVSPESSNRALRQTKTMKTLRIKPADKADKLDRSRHPRARAHSQEYTVNFFNNYVAKIEPQYPSQPQLLKDVKENKGALKNTEVHPPSTTAMRLLSGSAPTRSRPSSNLPKPSTSKIKILPKRSSKNPVKASKTKSNTSLMYAPSATIFSRTLGRFSNKADASKAGKKTTSKADTTNVSSPTTDQPSSSNPPPPPPSQENPNATGTNTNEGTNNSYLAKQFRRLSTIIDKIPKPDD